MKIKALKDSWEILGENEPYFAVLTNEANKKNQVNLKRFFNSGKIKVRAILKVLVTHNIKLSYNECLDFGCGVGRLTQALCHHFDKVTGVDISQSMLDKAEDHNKFKDKCTYINNDRADLQIFESDRYEFILCLLTLQHMSPHIAVNYISEFKRVLAPGGIMVLQIPSTAPIVERIVQTVVPKSLLNYFRKFRSTGGAIMEMYTHSKKSILDMFSPQFGVVDVEDAIDNRGWTYTTYYIQKK